MANDLEGGLALAAWLTASNVLTELARMGVIPADRAAEMTDNALLVVERNLRPEQAALKQSACSRLEGLHLQLRRLTAPDDSPAGGEPG